MENLFHAYDRALLALSRLASFAAGLFILAVAFIVCYEIVMRGLLNSPTEWVLEISTYLIMAAGALYFLIHAVDVEGKANGVERELVSILGEYADIPITYAGGVGSYEDVEAIRTLGKGRLNVTIGSALDLFGGHLDYNRVLSMMDDKTEEIQTV